MNKRYRIIPFFFLFLIFCACKKGGDDVTPEYDMYPYGNSKVSGAQINGSGLITLQQDTMNRVIKQTKGAQISNYGGYVMINGGGEVVIGVKDALSIGLNGGGVQNHDSVTMQSLFISGQAGTVVLKNIHVTGSIIVGVTNTGDWSIGGRTPYLSVSTSNFGRFFGFDLIVDSCVVSHGGLGDVQVNVTQKLTGNIESIGNLFYKGNPPIVNVTALASGKAIAEE